LRLKGARLADRISATSIQIAEANAKLLSNYSA